MSRIRSVKPEFFKDADLAREHSRDERLFYQGLWIEADDSARFVANTRTLLGNIFPYDEDIDEAWIEAGLQKLAALGRLVLYEVKGVRYGFITKFPNHQRINRPTPSKLPRPPRFTCGEPLTEPLTEGSLPRARGVAHVEQGAGSREQGREQGGDGAGKVHRVEETAPAKKGRARRKRRAGGRSAGADTTASEFDEIWTLFPKREGSNPKAAALAAFNARRKEGVPAAEMLAGTKRYASYIEATGQAGSRFVMQAASFLGPSKRGWEETWEVGPEQNGRRTARPGSPLARQHYPPPTQEEVRWKH